MRCRKARWFLSARCDGTLSERQRLRLESHLATCESCRREAFYFTEIGAIATRMDGHAVRPDFNLRLRAAIRRHEHEAAHPVPWQSRLAGILLRPGVVAAGVIVMGLGGLGAWTVTHKAAPVPQTISVEEPVPSKLPYGIPAEFGRSSTEPAAGELTPLDGLDPETRRIYERYLQAGQLPRDYIHDGIPLEDFGFDSVAPRYVMPTEPTDMAAKKVSY